MTSTKFWEKYEFELPTGTLIYRIEDTDIIGANDIIRSSMSATKWLRIKDGHNGLVGTTLAKIAWDHYRGSVSTEIMREYI